MIDPLLKKWATSIITAAVAACDAVLAIAGKDGKAGNEFHSCLRATHQINRYSVPG